MKQITGKHCEVAPMIEGAPFGDILGFLSENYPEIEKKYPPGTLGFTLNGYPPKVFETLKEGDVVRFMIFK